jgi:hypothetical protein
VKDRGNVKTPQRVARVSHMTCLSQTTEALSEAKSTRPVAYGATTQAPKRPRPEYSIPSGLQPPYLVSISKALT